MDDPLRVGRLEGVRDLGPEVQQRGEVDGPAPDPLRERLALEELHGDEVLALVLVDRVDGADPGVVEGRGRAGLALEALEGVCGSEASSAGRNLSATLRPSFVSSAS